MDSAVLFQLVCEIVGGLGLFLLGMKNMSDGMQAVAGSSLRRMIGAVTTNRYLATVVGVVVTCVVQSSSVTTVMVVGFVNSGLMQLTQAVGVIMGANIGTTITGWILVLKIGKYGLPIMGAAAFVYLFSKSDRWRYWAMAIMGVGMVFFGLELMKDACAIIKEYPEFEQWFQRFQADNYLGVLQCALAGCVLTTLVQSSSATLAITISLALQGIITYETAAALVLGENIGTTITAFLASLGTTTNARRAAYFHVIFNMIGVFWITLVFPWYIQLIQMIVRVDVNQPEVVLVARTPEELQQEADKAAEESSEEKLVAAPVAEPVANEPATGEAAEDQDDSTIPPGYKEVNTYPGRKLAIAMTHSVFNIANTLLFLPLAPLLVQFLNWLVPSKGYKEKPHLTDLDIRMLETPLLAIEQSRGEISKMGVGCARMLEWLMQLRDQTDPDKDLGNRLKHREEVLDSIHDEIAEFVTHLLSGNVPHSVAEEARGQLRMADEYESISDYVADLDKFDRKLRRDNHRFNDEQRRELNQLNAATLEYVQAINDAMIQQNRSVLSKTEQIAKRIRQSIKQLRRGHLDELSAGTTPPVVSVAFLATLNAYSRVVDHSYNIAEIVSGEK